MLNAFSSFIAHASAVGTVMKRSSGRHTAGYLNFGPMAQCVVHALKGLACRAPVLLAHANVTENINILSMGPKLRYPTVQFDMKRTEQSQVYNDTGVIHCGNSFDLMCMGPLLVQDMPVGTWHKLS